MLKSEKSCEGNNMIGWWRTFIYKQMMITPTLRSAIFLAVVWINNSKDHSKVTLKDTYVHGYIQWFSCKHIIQNPFRYFSPVSLCNRQSYWGLLICWHYLGNLLNFYLWWYEYGKKSTFHLTGFSWNLRSIRNTNRANETKSLNKFRRKECSLSFLKLNAPTRQFSYKWCRVRCTTEADYDWWSRFPRKSSSQRKTDEHLHAHEGYGKRGKLPFRRLMSYLLEHMRNIYSILRAISIGKAFTNNAAYIPFIGEFAK